MSRVSQNAASSGENKGGTATMAPPGTPQATPQPPLTEIESIEQLESRQSALTEGARERLKFTEQQMLKLQEEKNRLLALLGETAEEEPIVLPVLAPARRGGRVKGSKVVDGKLVMPGTASRKMKSEPSAKVGSVKAKSTGSAFNKTLAVLDVINQIAKKGVTSAEIVAETMKQYGKKMTPKDIASGLQAIRKTKRVQFIGEERAYTYYKNGVQIAGQKGQIYGKEVVK